MNAFRKHTAEYYRKPDGTRSSEYDNFCDALAPLLRLYGRTPAIHFGPLALKALRQEMIRLGWRRTNINRQIVRIRHVFKWAAGNEIIPASVYQNLQSVQGLKTGRSEAKESHPVEPVAEEHVEATLKHVKPLREGHGGTATAHRHEAGRSVRHARVRHRHDRQTLALQARDAQDAYRGHARVIYLGHKAQEKVQEFLKPNVQSYLFSPADAMQEVRAKRHENRRTPLSCGNTPGTNCAGRPKKAPTDRYTGESYCHAIHAACHVAFPPPAPLARQKVKGKKGQRWETHAEWQHRLGAEKWTEVQNWINERRWHPHQPRHTAATKLRKEFGLEAGQVILGHKTLMVTQVYAQKNIDSAQAIMARLG